MKILCNFHSKNILVHDKHGNLLTEGQQKDETSNICKICNATFADSYGVKRHIIQVHEKPKSHLCEVCSKSFTRPSDLRVHKETVHEGKKQHVCDFCSKSFSRKNHLNVHIAAVHEKQEKQNICELCGYRYLFSVSELRMDVFKFHPLFLLEQTTSASLIVAFFQKRLLPKLLCEGNFFICSTVSCD